MAANGGTVGDVRIGDCLEVLTTAAATGELGDDRHSRSPLFYQLLRARGEWTTDAPPVQVFTGRGQPSCEQLIDRYRIRCAAVRDVLIDYLRERQPAVDFSTLQQLAYLLGKLFWADLEAHHPGIDTLHLPRDVAAGWKQRVMTRTKTTTTTTAAPEPRCCRGGTVAACSPRSARSTSTWPSGPTTTRPGGRRGRCAARSPPATSPTRRTAPSASPGWTSGPGNGCRHCQA